MSFFDILDNLEDFTIPSVVVFLLLITLPPAAFYGGIYYDRKTYVPPPTPTPTPRNIVDAAPGPYHGTCKKYNLITNPKIAPPSNFPGYNESNLVAINGEITTIVKNGWLIDAGTARKYFILDSTVILDKYSINNYAVGDCVTLYYGLTKKGSERTFSVTTQ